MSYMINNNAFEVDPSPRNKRKRSLQCTNAYMNPALDILSTEDRMCNNLMEVQPVKRTRRSRSCDSRVIFENPALDLGANKVVVNDLMRKELANVNQKLTSIAEVASPAYQNVYGANETISDIIIEDKSLTHIRLRENTFQINSTPVIGNSSVPKRRASFDLSFIERLGIDDSTTGEALYLDDDLNESNIMEIKTIKFPSQHNTNYEEKKNTNPFLNCSITYDTATDQPLVDDLPAANNFPFDVPVQKDVSSSITSYDSSEPEVTSITSADNYIVPRRLFTEETIDDSIQYIDESYSVANNKFGHSTLNEQINYKFAGDSCRDKSVFVFGNDRVSKQSKILGCDVSNMTKNEIFNCDNNSYNEKRICIPNINNNIQATFKDNSLKQQPINNKKQATTKPNHKMSTKIFSKIKDVFKTDKKNTKNETLSGNPYEVVRKAPVQDKPKKAPPACFVNPALNLNSTDMDLEEEVEDDKLYNVAASRFVNRNPYQVTPMKHSGENIFVDKENMNSSQSSVLGNCVDLSDIAAYPETSTRKHVRFDSTLNHEKVITGNSFDSENNSSASNQSDGNTHQVTQVLNHIDTQIDEYHNELENCFNEKRFITQNL